MPVRWTTPAANDLIHICDFAAARFGPARARLTALAICDAAELLGTHPHLGRTGRRPNTRELVLPDLPFLIVYKVRHEAVEIARILHGAQKWP